MLERLRSDLITAARALMATPVTTFATRPHARRRGRRQPRGLRAHRSRHSDSRPSRRSSRPPVHARLRGPGDAGRGAGMTTTSYVAFDTIREHVPALARAGAWRRTPTTVLVAGEQTRAEAMLVSGSYFAAPRRRGPARSACSAGGRRPGLEQHGRHQPRVLALGVRRRSPRLGRRLTVNRIEYVVSGVMPAGLQRPFRGARGCLGAVSPPRCATRRAGITTRSATW